MPYIEDYYPDLVQIMLACSEQRRPLILLVDCARELDTGKEVDEGPEGRIPDVRDMFPKDSEVHEITFDSWVTLGKGDNASQFVTPAKGLRITDILVDKTAICLVLPLLNVLSGLGEDMTRDASEHVIWKPLFAMLEAIPDETRVLIPAPIRLLRLPGFGRQRHRLFDEHRAFIVEHEDPYSAIRFGMGGGHNPHNMATIVVWKEQGTLAFYRLMKPDLNDFRKRVPLLIAGKTKKLKDGFVHEGPLDLHKPTLYSSYLPGLQKEDTDVQALSEIADIMRGPRLSAASGSGNKCLTHTCITPDLVIDLGFLICVTHDGPIDPSLILQTGDILLSSQTDRLGMLRIARLDTAPKKTLYDDTLIVIRFKKVVPNHVKELALTILQSPAATKILFPDGKQPLLDLDLEWVKAMRFPIGADTVSDYQNICQMRARFSSWTARANELIQGLILEDSSDSIRHRIQQRDKEIRLIDQAGKSVMNPYHCLARYLPRPLSFVWAEHRASVRSDPKAYYERMAKVRKAGETLVASLALIAYSYVHHLDKDSTSAMRLSKARKKYGFDFGTWAAIFEAACRKLAVAGVRHLYIPEFGNFVKDNAWKIALESLIRIRNKDSHLRLTNAELISEVESAEKHLRIMFDKVSFLSDWSLRIVDTNQWDSHTSISNVAFRELHGTTVYAETENAKVSDVVLECGSLYLVNKLGKQHWHLLRPFFLLKECPDHHIESIFHLDSFRRDEKGQEDVLLRSFEFNSTISTSKFNAILRKSGLME